MKKTKVLSSVLVAALALSTAATLTACGNHADGGKTDDTKEPVTISYQLTGEYTDDTLKSMGFDYFYLLNLTSDNKLTYSGYNILSMDTSAYATNEGFAEKWGKGTWENGKDEEDQDCIVMKMRYDSDAKNLQSGETLTLPGTIKTYYLYKGADGNIKFEIDVPFSSGRKADCKGSSTVTYSDYDAFISGVKFTEKIADGVLLEDTKNHFKLSCQEDGTAILYKGTQDKKTQEWKHAETLKGNWSYEGGKLTILDNSATVEDKKVTLSYAYKSQLGDKDLILTAEDGSKLLKEGSGKVVATVATFNGTGSMGAISLTLKEDGTGEFKSMNTVKFAWSRWGNKLTLTEPDSPDKTPIIATIDGDGKCKFTYDSKFNFQGTEVQLGGELTCEDCSGIAQGKVVFSGADGKTVNFTGDGKCELFVSMAGHEMKTAGAWEYKNDTLSVTTEDGSSTISAVTIEGDAATFTWNYKPSFAGGADLGGEFSCDDISLLIG